MVDYLFSIFVRVCLAEIDEMMKGCRWRGDVAAAFAFALGAGDGDTRLEWCCWKQLLRKQH